MMTLTIRRLAVLAVALAMPTCAAGAAAKPLPVGPSAAGYAQMASQVPPPEG